MSTLKETRLNTHHRNAGGKMVDFGGWDLPVRYSSQIAEHECVRTKAGLFDVSHMGEIRVTGAGAGAYVNQLVPNNTGRLADGQVMYTPMCLPTGGVIDDLLVYRISDSDYLLCVNAANTDKDVAWVQENKPADVSVENQSPAWSQIAVQGPAAEGILQSLVKEDLSDIRYYWFKSMKVPGGEAIVSRTGYTGEDGFEVYTTSDPGPVWDALLQEGQRAGIQPAGLGARDTLRLEAGMPLYGHELNESRTPYESGIGWTVKLKKGDFIGSDQLRQKRKAGFSSRLVGLELGERNIARQGYAVCNAEGQSIGEVTSGTMSPTLKKPIAFAFVPTEYSEVGTSCKVAIRDRLADATVISTPFYKRS
jgi:aminomethyltransferase